MRVFSFVSKDFHLPILIISILVSSYFAFDIYKAMKDTGVSEPSKEEKLDTPKVEKNERAMEPFSHYEVILKRNIFFPPELQSEAKKSTQPVGDGETKGLPELRIALKGTIVGINYNSMAAIENLDEKKERLYRINDTIGDAKITGIFRDRVVLSRAGKEEILTIFQERRKEAPQRGKVPTEQIVPREKPSQPPLVSQEMGHGVIKREELREGTSSIQYLMTQLRIKPNFSSGRPEGFMVSDIKPGSPVHRAGIQNGDIIKGINGLRIDTPSQLLKAYRELRDVKDIEIEVEREGQRKNISIKVE